MAEFRLGFVSRALERGRVGNIHLYRVGADIERGELAARDLKLCPLDVGEHDIDAVVRQCPANAEADAIGRTRDKGGLAGEVHYDRPERTARGCDWSEGSSTHAAKPSTIN